MKLPDFLKFKNESFSTKIFYLFTALLLTAYISFSFTFVHHQSKTLKNNLVHQGEMLTDLLARNSKLGVFAENSQLLASPVESIINQKDALLVQIFAEDGRELISAGKNTGKETGIHEGKEMPARAVIEKIKSSRAVHYSETGDMITFWAPVFSGSTYTGDKLSSLIRTDAMGRFDRNTAPAVDQEAEKRIIGYAKTVFTTSALKEEIAAGVRQSLIVPIFFLIPVWIIVFLFVKGITSPLNLLTERVTALGTGGPVNKIPVDTDDEIGKLADAFNNMVDSLAAKELEKTQIEEQLRQSQKMEAVGTLAGGVAHDFNNILNIIIGYGSLLKKKAAFKENEKKYIDSLIATAEKASSITKSLLSFSRQDTVNLRPAKINSIISGMENLIKRFLGENIELNTILTDKDPTVLTDPGLIEQTLFNLISNSRDAMSAGGTLTIRTDSLITEKELYMTSGWIAPGEYALIVVEDTGTGMDEATKEKMFDPFFTTKDVGKGTGLGLSITYGTVRQHKGSIDVDSSPGKGTSFRIYMKTIDLPLGSVEERELPEPVHGTESILLAEDNDELRELTENILKEYGYRTIAVSDGEEAVRKFRENPDGIDLLLLDVMMPGKNGKEVLQAAKEVRPDIKVLFISAYTAEKLNGGHTFAEMSKLHFLQKPYQPARLLKTVRDIIDERSF